MALASPLRIVAPVASAEDARRVLDAGADELYCGAMFDDWVRRFGEADLISRRQGRPAHITGPGELRRVARLAAGAGRKIALALNVGYTRIQQEAVRDLAGRWEDAGGTQVIVSDPGLLMALAISDSRLERHLSLMAGAFNSASVRFFKSFGISRVVLPRDLTLKEAGAITANDTGIEYEMLAMLQKCQFIDGFCGFYHGVGAPAGRTVRWNVDPDGAAVASIVRRTDPDYEGHGCRLDYRTPLGPVRHLETDDMHAPHCAACLLPELARSRIGYLKIAGRGFPVDAIARTVALLRYAIGLFRESDDLTAARASIRNRYRRVFGTPCRRGKCYYSRR